MSRSEEEPTPLRLGGPEPEVAFMALLGWAICSVACVWLLTVMISIVVPLSAIVMLVTPQGRARARKAFKNWPREKK